jgi:hypothetical protein
MTTTHGRCPTSVSDTGVHTPQQSFHDTEADTAAAPPLPVTGTTGPTHQDMTANAASAAADQATAGHTMSHGAGPTLSELLQMPDDVQAGMDSPRAISRAGHRRSLTPLSPRSLAGTPGATGKGEEQER